MRGLFLSAAVVLSLFVACAAQADIAPDPTPNPPPEDVQSTALAVAGTALSLGVVSLGLWLRRRNTLGKANR